MTSFDTAVAEGRALGRVIPLREHFGDDDEIVLPRCAGCGTPLGRAESQRRGCCAFCVTVLTCSRCGQTCNGHGRVKGLCRACYQRQYKAARLMRKPPLSVGGLTDE